MKDIKSYVIGFLTCACLFLIMGATAHNTGNGRYQLVTSHMNHMLLDTKTGITYQDKFNPDKSPINENGEIVSMSYWEKYIVTIP